MSRALQIFVSHPSHCLTDHLPHGDGLIAMSFLKNLATRGHTLHVAAPLAELSNPVPSNIHLYPIVTRAQISPAEQSLAFRVEYAWHVRQLFDRVHRQHRVDVIHQLNPAVLGLSVLLHGRGVPVVAGPVWPAWEPEDAAAAGIFQRVRRAARTSTLRANFLRTDVALVPTRASARVLAEASVPEKIVQLLHIGVDVDLFHPDLAAEPSQPTILFLANLQKRKGMYVLLDAFEQVARELPTACLRIAGSGEEHDGLERRVAGMGCRSRIELLGNIARENIVPTLQRCSVYCLPSFGEPFGMSALEAMACGLPLVTTNSGGLADLVRQEGGLQVPMRDPAALAAALTQLLTDAELRRRMGRYNRNLTTQEYAWQRVTERLEAIYDGAIAAQTRSRSTAFAATTERA